MNTSPQNPVQAAQNHTAALVSNLAAKDTSKVAARVFRSNIPSMRYIFKAGKVASFLSGIYYTDIAHEITELDAEIAHGHPNISSKPDEVVTSVDPLEILKQKHFEEFKAQMAKSLAVGNNAGDSDAGKPTVTTSATLLAGMTASDSGAPAAPTGGIKVNVSK
jgi:hypothetical protein